MGVEINARPNVRTPSHCVSVYSELFTTSLSISSYSHGLHLHWMAGGSFQDISSPFWPTAPSTRPILQTRFDILTFLFSGLLDVKFRGAEENITWLKYLW